MSLWEKNLHSFRDLLEILWNLTGIHVVAVHQQTWKLLDHTFTANVTTLPIPRVVMMPNLSSLVAQPPVPTVTTKLASWRPPVLGASVQLVPAVPNRHATKATPVTTKVIDSSTVALHSPGGVAQRDCQCPLKTVEISTSYKTLQITQNSVVV